MPTLVRVLGVLCMLTGIIWILQGVNILPGSFMTGQRQWAVYGAITLVAGAALLWWSGRMPPRVP